MTKPIIIKISKRANNLSNKVFGRLTALYPCDKTKSNVIKWFCQCECGNTSIVLGVSLSYGATKSCGCLFKERSSKRCDRNITHGLTKSVEYKIWSGMKRRCYNEHDKSFKYYGAKGIVMSDKWVYNFQQFLDDLGKRPSTKHSIDRIDSNKSYSKENCRWVGSQKEQNRNKTNNRKITWRGETKCLMEWSEITGLNRRTIAQRLGKNWSAEDALTIVPWGAR